MAREATLSVSLTNRLKSYVQDKVRSGQFESASEVIRQGLRTMQEQEERERLFWSDLPEKVNQPRAAIDDGNAIDGPAFMRSKIASLRAQARKSAAKKKRS
jgi:antitoxin ParD1/3/4